MDINTEITNSSWVCSAEKAKDYLHYYPKEMKIKLSEFISTISGNPTVLNVDGDFPEFVKVLKNNNTNLDYTGVDIVDSLLDVAKSVVGDDGEVIKDDIFKYLTSYSGPKFDFGVLSHMLECVESPDLLMGRASDLCEHVAIHWYDPPTYEYDATIIAKNPHSEDSFKPYIRRKMGKDYWSYIINRYNLTLVYRVESNPKNVLEIYKKK